MQILVVDDHRSARRVLTSILEDLPTVVLHEASDLASARAVLEAHPIDIALVDVRLSDDPRNRDGHTLVAEMRARSRAAPIVVTTFGEMSEIRAAMRAGAFDYLLKEELSAEIVLHAVESVRSRRQLENEVLSLRARCAETPGNLGLVGSSARMERVRERIRRVAVSDRPVLVTGPSGSGKELVVEALHRLGRHPEASLLDLNCGAFPESLIEAQLFGHERGAFTGAHRRSEGYLAAVGKGTLFLDEIAELSLGLQAKLLRALETGSYRPVGSMNAETFIGRVIAATHADLAERVRAGTFRQDLYYRLNVLEIHVPSLDERREDIAALAIHFAAEQSSQIRFAADALEWLAEASWPGNVRELRNFIDRVAVLTDDDPVTARTLDQLHADEQARPYGQPIREAAQLVLRAPADGDKLVAIEDAVIEAAMERTGGNKAAAARLLGVGRKAVERRVTRLSRNDDGEGESS